MLTNYEKETCFNFNEAEKEAVVFTYNASLILLCYAQRIVPCNGTDSQIEKCDGRTRRD